jgi:hypothetical protein
VVSNRIGKDIDVFSRAAYQESEMATEKHTRAESMRCFIISVCDRSINRFAALATEIGSIRSVFLQ